MHITVTRSARLGAILMTYGPSKSLKISLLHLMIFLSIRDYLKNETPYQLFHTDAYYLLTIGQDSNFCPLIEIGSFFY